MDGSSTSRSEGSLALRLLILVAASTILGTGVNLLRPTPLPWVQDWSNQVAQKATELGIRVVDTTETEQIIAEGLHFLFDARHPDLFAAGHLPTAMSLPSEAFDESFMDVAGFLVPEQGILVYCSGHACDESLVVCEALQGLGYTNLVLFAGGFEDWTAAGLAVEGGP